MILIDPGVAQPAPDQRSWNEDDRGKKQKTKVGRQYMCAEKGGGKGRKKKRKKIERGAAHIFHVAGRRQRRTVAGAAASEADVDGNGGAVKLMTAVVWAEHVVLASFVSSPGGNSTAAPSPLQNKGWKTFTGTFSLLGL
ncbi:conserved hypothetical protein [Coccidioides posadasii str. Silveira]|uniref:Uncharacterized protein n=1 Tax=Coccidioides posadasii (strain RMSCC 757 / Silveira) TaxID=443226 RepID=E9CWQ0_COCPS|nr:conserved hypothetical protein [Coccidioides posadasii str. Silveira]